MLRSPYTSVVNCLLLLFCFIFFFKQKTAYEMRISDWSSDVCSSDLFAAPVIRKIGEEVRRDPALAAKVELRCRPAEDLSGLPFAYFDTIVINSVKLGRASCRESVCQ